MLLLFLTFIILVVYTTEKNVHEYDEEYLNMLCNKKLASKNLSCHDTRPYRNIYSIESNLSLPNDSIFFIDASCYGVLDLRQACSVESAARNHPKRQIYVLFSGPVTEECLKTSPMWQILQYRNVHILRVHLKEYLADTHLTDVLRGGTLDPNLFPVEDVVKLVTLYKFGGIFLDFDILVMKPLDKLPIKDNWVARIDDNNLGSALLAFQKYGIGRSLSQEILSIMQDPAYIYSEGFNIEDTIVEALENICETKVVSKMSATTCHGFEIYDSSYFYPIQQRDWRRYFQDPTGISQTPFTFCLWSYSSHDNVIYQESLYAQLMGIACPLIYKLMI